MPTRALSEYLDRNSVNYRCYNHPPAVTAAELAEITHIPRHQMAKTVIVKADGRFIMVVLPSDHHIDLKRLQEVIGARELRLAYEQEFSPCFPDCEAGGMPPLGNLYQMRVFMDISLCDSEWLAFNAGTHTETIKMDVNDFIRLASPVLCGCIRSH